MQTYKLIIQNLWDLSTFDNISFRRKTQKTKKSHILCD